MLLCGAFFRDILKVSGQNFPGSGLGGLERFYWGEIMGFKAGRR